MTDYWLDFVSVRRREEEATPLASQKPESSTHGFRRPAMETATAIPLFENLLRVRPVPSPEIKNSIRERLKNNVLVTALQKLF